MPRISVVSSAHRKRSGYEGRGKRLTCFIILRENFMVGCNLAGSSSRCDSKQVSSRCLLMIVVAYMTCQKIDFLWNACSVLVYVMPIAVVRSIDSVCFMPVDTNSNKSRCRTHVAVQHNVW